MAKGFLFNRLNQLISLIEGYTYPEPLNLYLSKYFKEHKKLGGRDRKQVKAWFYLYFKSNYLRENVEEELLILLQNDKSEILKPLRLSLDNIETSGLKEQFPLSDKISKLLAERTLSDLKAEKLFWLRSEKQLENAEQQEGNLYGFKQGTSIAEDKILQIQDLASHQAVVLSVKSLEPQQAKAPLSVWDACAGAGGKSLALVDLMKIKGQDIDLFTSDIRPQKAKTLKHRLQKSGHEHHQSAVLDLSIEQDKLQFANERVGKQFFDAIILDVPCSGSGTWGRNAQHLRYFNQAMLDKYLHLQNQIVANALPFLKPKGKLFYITCSVYADENENQVKDLCDQNKLSLTSSAYLGNKYSDQMFWACLVNEVD